MLELFDGACCLMQGKAKPRAWTDAAVKVAKIFTAQQRTDAAAAAQVRLCSGSVQLASGRGVQGDR